MNLLEETVEAIKDFRHAPVEVVFIGSMESGYSCTWVEFTTLANREYDPGYGAQQVASDLIIAFSDGEYMTRGEYDGSEWWQLIKPFKAPTHTHPIKTLFPLYSLCLAETHKRDEAGELI